MVALGTPMPAFELWESKTQEYALSENFVGEKGTLVIFMCNHCPFVVHLIHKLAEKTKEWKNLGIKSIGISSNDANAYPQDAPRMMTKFAVDNKMKSPYFYDETQAVATAFGAVCTPDFFLYDGKGELFYRGQFDPSRPGDGQAITGENLQNAVSSLLDGKNPPEKQLPSQGCNIKWK